MSDLDNKSPKTTKTDENTYVVHHFTVDPGQEALRIDKFIVSRLEHATRNRVQSAIADGFLTVNGEHVRSNYKVRPNDEIELRVLDTREESEIIPEDIPLDIVYEDDDLLVINKPVGMVVHPGVGNYTGTLLNALSFYFKIKVDFEGKRPWLVHRIDKNTSGLLVVAKNDQALTKLSAQFKKKTIDRKYVAIVWGEPEEAEGTIETYIKRDPRDRKRYVATMDEENAKHAVTHYKVLESFLYVSLLECKLETGRTHQIRVHMKHLGHPLFNDEKYGGDKILKGVVFSKYKQFVDNCFQVLPRQALHAKTLGFTHPTTGEWMQFDSDLPPDIEEVIEKWRVVHSSNRFN